MPRLLAFVFVALALIAASTAIYFYRESRALREELAALQNAPVETALVSTARVEPPESATSVEATANAAQASSEPAAPAAAPSRGAGEDRPRFDRRDRGQEFFARALADPDARAAMLTRAKGQIDRMFGDYFVKLGLNETQIEALRTLLAERQMARMESGMLERAAETDQERAEAQAWREARLATAEADINAILGADGLKDLQGYLDSAPQRQVVDDIARRANYAGAPLTSEANDRLLDTVRQAVADVPLPQLPGRGGWNDGDGGQRREPVTTETVSTYMDGLRARNQQIIEQARTFLTQPQLEALADQQIDEMQQAEAQLNFMLRNPDARGPGGGFGGGGRRPGGGGG